jgi:aryl-alcohol dehydrogenase-like predicted oxidoreductase
MEYTTLGDTGVTISKICLGCMGFGTSSWRDWVLDEDESVELIEEAIDLGVNFFDTANTYSNGASERVLGTALEGYDREEFVVATKGYFGAGTDNPNAVGLSRKAIDIQLQASLDRLGLDTIDLYQIHRLDDAVANEDIVRTLDDAVRRGDVRYPGASSMWAREFEDLLSTSERLGLERFRTMQNHYNLVYREEEREMLPLCQREDVAVIPWSPLARGYLTRPKERIDDTVRGESEKTQPGGTSMYEHPYREGGGPEINARVAELADDYGVSMAQIAVAWLNHNEYVDAPIIGTTSVDHLREAAAALDIDLSTSDVEYLEEPYEAVAVSPPYDTDPRP